MVANKVIEVLNNGKLVYLPESDRAFIREIKMEMDVLVSEVVDEETNAIILVVRKNPKQTPYCLVKWYNGQGHKFSHRTIKKNLTVAKANALLKVMFDKGTVAGTDYQICIQTM